MENVINLLRLTGDPGGAGKAAEQKLQEFERVAGFALTLFQLGVSQSVEPGLRLLALIVLKNSIDRCWRRASLTPLSVDEREQIKRGIIENLYLEHRVLAVQHALIAGRVARFEGPRQWPALLESLAQALRDKTRLQRPLYVLYQVLKELSKKKIARREFEEACLRLIPLVRGVWTEQTMTLIQALTAKGQTQQAAVVIHLAEGNEPQLLEFAQTSLLCCKCLKLIVVGGITNPETNPDTRAFFVDALQALRELLALLPQIRNPTLKQPAGKIMIRLFETASETLMEQPLAFGVSFLIPYLQASHTVLERSLDSRGNLVFEGCTVQALNFYSKLLLCPAFQAKGGLTYSTIAGPKFEHEKTDIVKAELAKVFTSQYVKQFALLLITRFLVLRDTDLHSWESTPEDFVADEQGMRADEKIRPAAENLFGNLLKRFPAVAGALCVEMVSGTCKHPLLHCPPRNSPEFQNLLVKEAVYLVVGTGSFELEKLFQESTIDFGMWYHEVLSKEINSTDPGLRILRRKVIWMVGEWIGQIPDEMKPNVYRDVVNLLRQPDIVVRMTTASALQRMVEDMSFVNHVPTFVPFLNAVLEALFQLLKDCTQVNSRLQVISAVRSVVEAVGDFIAPGVDILRTQLAIIWQACGQEQNILRPAILVTLTFLVQARRGESYKLHDFLIPCIKLCTADATRPDAGFLAEPALELWHATMQFAPVMTPELMSLFPHWISFALNSLEQLEITTGLLESYILLGREILMTPFADSICSTCLSLCSRASDHGVILVTNVLETVAQIFPQHFPHVFRPIMNMMMEDIKTGSPPTARFTPGPPVAQRIHNGNIYKTQPEEAPPVPGGKSSDVLVAYLHVLARLIFQNWDTMKAVLSSMSPGSTAFLCKLLDIWTGYFDCMTLVDKKKVSALALLRVLDVADAPVFQRIGPILACCTSVMLALENPEEEDPGDVMEAARNEADRVQALVRDDPAAKIDLRQTLMTTIQVLAARLGQQAWNGLMSTVDPDVVAALR